MVGIISRVGTSLLDVLDGEYERCEAAFLAGVRHGADREHLASLVRAVALAAEDWNTEAYRLYHAATGRIRAELDLLTERTEVLTELWTDLAAAYSTGITLAPPDD